MRRFREELGLTMREVESASREIALRHKNEEFIIFPSRLSDFETRDIVPSIHRMYSLAVIYRRDMRELLAWYDVDTNLVATDMDVVSPRKSHVSATLASIAKVNIPIRFDPSFDPRQTRNFGRMVKAWGLVALTHLAQFAHYQYRYGYIGSEDFTMYPILPPGSFVQVDESKNKVVEGSWGFEYERPIYFVKTWQGCVACWCTLKGAEIVLTPHPLSPVMPRTLRYPQKAEVIGQVVGAARAVGQLARPDFGHVFEKRGSSRAERGR